jgi:hypothetical protein
MRFAEAARWLCLPAVLILLSGLATAAVAILRPSDLQSIVAAGGGACSPAFVSRFSSVDAFWQNFGSKCFAKAKPLSAASRIICAARLRTHRHAYARSRAVARCPPHAVETTTPLRQRLDQLSEVFAKNAAELGLAPDEPTAKA